MDVLASYSIFQELQLVHDTGYFSALPSLEDNWQQTCLELERYLQTEPKRLSELFDENLDSLLTPAFLKEDSDHELSEPVPPNSASQRSPATVLHSPGTCSESQTGVNAAQLSAVTSLTPPSSPELGRHLIKPAVPPMLTARADGTLTLKLTTLAPSKSLRFICFFFFTFLYQSQSTVLLWLTLSHTPPKYSSCLWPCHPSPKMHCPPDPDSVHLCCQATASHLASTSCNCLVMQSILGCSVHPGALLSVVSFVAWLLGNCIMHSCLGAV
uniref:KLF transcription factor 7 n=1 Tax=Scleropages formosus TaxID=113540 RepID=A0A8C9VGH7_SCLFO